MATTYQNPVYGEYMADPFVLRFDGHYYAYGTTRPMREENKFRLLESADLAHWEARGGALVPLAGGEEYWAPEVACRDGVFTMYYSASGIGGQDQQLRAATSPSPLGPFIDCGRLLVPDQPFTIDAHPFRDASGDWYLFYSRDFLTLDGNQRVGTGIVVDRLLDMTTLAGNPQVVVRPTADWQLFMAQRSMYGGVYDWYTIEGAATRVHDGKLYCFYSGGAWERSNYGVSYVVAEHPLGPYRAPNNARRPVLQSIPGVIGPGHCSFTESPDGEEFIIYHAWDAAMTARLMRIDRLQWIDDLPVVLGPTTTPQPLQAAHGADPHLSGSH